MSETELLNEATGIIKRLYWWNAEYREGKVPSHDAELILDDLVAHAESFMELMKAKPLTEHFSN